MKSHLIILLGLFLFISCSTSESEYSEEELETLEKAQQTHNEAMAIFSQTRDLIAEITEARAKLVRQTGFTINSEGKVVEVKDSLSPLDSDSKNLNSEDTTSGQQKQNTTSGQPTDDESVTKPLEALRQLNLAQAALTDWMRSIYQVPGTPDIYEDEKTEEDPAIGLDYDSKMLLTDMEFKEYDEGTSVEEILASQKELKENILEVQQLMKVAVENAREAYIYAE